MRFSDYSADLIGKAMYDTTMNQVYALCSLSVDSGQGEYAEALVRARIFWYAHITDGVTSGLRGGRISLYGCDFHYPPA